MRGGARRPRPLALALHCGDSPACALRTGQARAGRRCLSHGGGGDQSLDGTRVTTPHNTQVKSLLLERASGESRISLWKPEASWTPHLHLRQDEEGASSTSPPVWPELVPYRPHPLYSCLENPRDGGACWAAAHGRRRWRPTPVLLPGCNHTCKSLSCHVR